MSIPDRYQYKNHIENGQKPVEVEAELGNVRMGYMGVGDFRKLDGAEGFTGAYSFPPDYDLFSDEAHEDHVKMIVDIAERTMEQQGWNGIDVLHGASISARKEVVSDAAQVLREKGYYIGINRNYSFACLGGMAGVADVLLDKDLHGARTLVVPYEFLSGNAMNPATEPKYNALRDMFGNGVAWMSFVAGVDLECIYGRTVVEVDKEGVIQVPLAQEMDEVGEKLTPPGYYQFIDDSVEYFAWTANGAYQQMPRTPNPSGYTEMKPLETLKLFTSGGAKYIPEDENIYQTYFQDQYGLPGERWIHQPSKTVVKGLERKIRLAQLVNQGIDEKEGRRLERLSPEERKKVLTDLGITDIELPWVMENTGLNNISGATSFVMLAEMIRMGRIKQGVVTPTHGFAIGAMYGNYYMRFK